VICYAVFALDTACGVPADVVVPTGGRVWEVLMPSSRRVSSAAEQPILGRARSTEVRTDVRDLVRVFTRLPSAQRQDVIALTRALAARVFGSAEGPAPPARAGRSPSRTEEAPETDQ